MTVYRCRSCWVTVVVVILIIALSAHSIDSTVLLLLPALLMQYFASLSPLKTSTKQHTYTITLLLGTRRIAVEARLIQGKTPIDHIFSCLLAKLCTHLNSHTFTFRATKDDDSRYFSLFFCCSAKQKPVFTFLFEPLLLGLLHTKGLLCVSCTRHLLFGF